jgi:hypothetical protein
VEDSRDRGLAQEDGPVAGSGSGSHEPDWGAARDRAREQVRELWAAAERTCPRCGYSSVTAARACPRCATPYVARRAKTLSTRRARLLAAAVAAGLLAIGGGLVLVLAPGIERTKRINSANAGRLDAAALRSLQAHAAAEQRLRMRRAVRDADPGPRTPASRRLRARQGLVAVLARSIGADARARVRAGTLTGPVLSVRCSPYPPGSAAADAVLAERVGSYACLVVNRQVVGPSGVVGFFGDPFWARIDFSRGLLAWCKVNPRPGEGGAGTGPPPVPLAAECDLEQPVPVGF